MNKYTLRTQDRYVTKSFPNQIVSNHLEGFAQGNIDVKIASTIVYIHTLHPNPVVIIEWVQVVETAAERVHPRDHLNVKWISRLELVT